MNTTETAPELAPWTTRIAGNGLVAGFAMCVFVLLIGFSAHFDALSLFVWIAAAVFPFGIYRLIKRSYIASDFTLSFGEIFSEALATFMLGSLFPAAMAYLLLRFAYPDFIAMQYDSAVQAFASLNTPEGNHLAEALRQFRANAPLPDATTIAANIISFNAVMGLLSSVVIAAVMTLANRPKSN